MCSIKFIVAIPTVETCLHCVNLRTGSMLILIWTMLRAVGCLAFFVWATIHVLVLRQAVFGANIDESILILAYLFFIGMILAENSLFIGTISFAGGLVKACSAPIAAYLIVRFFSWVLEMTFLILLCVFVKLFLEVYLGILFFVVAEIYSFLVVYSYYYELWEEEEACKPCEDGIETKSSLVEKSSEEKSSVEKSSDEKSSDEKSSEEKISEEKTLKKKSTHPVTSQKSYH